MPIAANIVTGIGFLGAGAILRDRSGIVVGMTTAATIFVEAAIGMAIRWRTLRFGCHDNCNRPVRTDHSLLG